MKAVAICLLVCLVVGVYSVPTRAQDEPTSTAGTRATIPPTNTPRPTVAPLTATATEGMTETVTEAVPEVVTEVATETLQSTSEGTATDTPTPAPPIFVVVTSTPTLPITPATLSAQLCATCSRIRLRSTPGTAGSVLDFFSNPAQLIVLGRSDDSSWVKVQIQNQATGATETGWISLQYVVVANGQPVDPTALNSLPVMDTTINAPPTPTSQAAFIPSWLTGITAHSHDIFRHGQMLGNHPDVFSRVGDSISVSPYFLTPIGQRNYDLGKYSTLSGAIAYFSQTDARGNGNSFVNTPIAAGSGWSAFTALIPGFSQPTLCGKDSPLVCEYKLVKPSVALIMFGTNDSGSGSPDQFAGNMRQIIQTSIDMGVIPVLSTIPPKKINDAQAARVDAFNTVIRQLAQQYDIPLWDYFSMMQAAPNGGMSTDGIHPSVPPGGGSGHFTDANLQYGFTIRNLMALQVLDALWRSEMY